MAEATEIPTFRPDSEWLEDWPFDVDTSVQVEASITGPAADHAVERFLEPLTEVLDGSVPDGVRVHHWGGFSAETAPGSGGDGWVIVLESSGEDGFSSLQGAADDLADVLRTTPGAVRLIWRELPATRASGADDRRA